MEKCNRILNHGVILPDDKPFNMCVELLLGGDVDEETGVADAHVMWLANAQIAKKRGLNPSMKTIADFALIQVPVDREGPIRCMTSEALGEVLFMFVWCIDGNVLDNHVRDQAWFAEAFELLELILHRAYFLATETLTRIVHNKDEYTDLSMLDDVDLPLGGESDDEVEDLKIGRVENKERELNTSTNDNFVWDFCAYTTHALTQLSCVGRLVLTRPARTVFLEEARTGLIRACGKDDSLHPDLLEYRKQYEYELICNMADRRLSKRKQPTRRGASAFGILGCKGERFIGTTDNPIVWHPRSFADMFDRCRERELFKDRDIKESQLYRVNSDAALCFVSTQSHDGIVQKLILKDWELQHPLLENGPRIIYIRALLRWGVVFAWPNVTLCNSLLEAYEFLRMECERLEICIMDDSTDPELPDEPLKLFQCKDLQ